MGTDSPAAMDALAADGGIVRLRTVRPADADPLAALHERGTPESLRMRFFGLATESTLAAEVERLLRPPSADHDVVVAEVAGAGLVGVASYERSVDDPHFAEFAVFVDGAQHGRGIGTLLLEFLAARARRRGIRQLLGEVLPSNAAMLRVARDLDSGAPQRFDQGVVQVRYHTKGDDAAMAEVDARDRTSRAASLGGLLAPRSVAVVGAGRAPGGIGHAIVQSMIDYGFTGDLYAVNPNASRILGLPGYPTVSGIGRPVDLVVICVPAPAVISVLQDAAVAGVRAAVVVSAGFDEAGAAGFAGQADVVRIARQHGIRLVGPNCLGVLNTDPAIRLAATFAPVLPRAGGLALASQSGAVGVAVLENAARTGSGVSSFVSLGNKADVSGNDLLSYWFDDPATRAVALYLESFGNPRRFARIARALARRKPVIAVVAGRSVAGRRAGASHTAASAAPDVAVETLCAQAGIIRVEHLGELLDVARCVTDQPLPGGNRLAIFGNAGGVNVLAADAADAAGLTLPGFSERLRAELDHNVAGAANPLDLGAAGNAAAFAESFERIASSGEADAVLVVVAATRANSVTAILDALAPAVDRHQDLAVAVVLLGAEGQSSLGQREAPVFDLPERAVAAMAKAARYAAWRAEPLGVVPALSGVESDAARASVQAALTEGGAWQPHARAADILGRYGIPVVPTATVAGERHAVEQALMLGLPVALKAADPDLVHKTDIGGVRLGLRSEEEVIDAYRAIREALQTPEPAVLVQAMAAGEVELVAGISHDPLFGSLVMLGLGGVHTAIFGDRAFRLVPLTERDADHMWRSLRAAPLLTGYRGSSPVKTDAISELVLRLGRLADELPEVAELDLNPIIVSGSGALVVDAKMRLAEVGAEPDAALRGLLGSASRGETRRS
jgi:acyl-CoA synthetase (NDP forming)/GNAT superfamily N-acetyltransferase